MKVVELDDYIALSGKIATNSNNQNATRARDLKSINPIQERLKNGNRKLADGDIHDGVNMANRPKASALLRLKAPASHCYQ